MAESENNDDIDITEENSGKSKKMIIIAVVALALIGGGIAMFLGGGEEATATDEKETENIEASIKKKPIYLSVKDAFIVNFSNQSKGAVRYLQIKLKVMARDQNIVDAFKLHTPAIRHQLLLLFLNQKYDELNTTKGTQSLQKKTLLSINEVLKAEDSGELEAVYFTSLIMQ